MTVRDVVLVDNQDSFTFNLVEALERLGARVRTFRNDAPLERLLAEAERAAAAGHGDRSVLFLLSPGPGGPDDAGVSLALAEAVRGRFPVLGICLGHQVLLAAAGATVERADEPVHGVATELHERGSRDPALARGRGIEGLLLGVQGHEGPFLLALRPLLFPLASLGVELHEPIQERRGRLRAEPRQARGPERHRALRAVGVEPTAGLEPATC